MIPAVLLVRMLVFYPDLKLAPVRYLLANDYSDVGSGTASL